MLKSALLGLDWINKIKHEIDFVKFYGNTIFAYNLPFSRKSVTQALTLS